MTKRKRGEPLRPVVIGPCEATDGADVAEVTHAALISERKALVDRFLRWPLPKSVAADFCVTDPDYQFPRSGTNLLTADEAAQMLEYLLGPV